MSESGGQPGNHNAQKGMDWRDAIRRALARHGSKIKGEEGAYRKGLDAVADKFLEAAANGDPWAMKELGDRTDGRAVQAVELSGPGGESLKAEINYIPICQPSDK